MANPAPTAQTNTEFEVRPVSTHIGAEIHGLDISRPLEEAERRAVWDALLTWKVVFFRDQKLDHQSQVAFCRQFGELTPAHVVFGGDEEFPEVYSVAKNRTANSNRDSLVHRAWAGWHTDITATHNPPAASVLRGEIVPPYGGDTQWTNLAAAYRALSPTMQAFVDGLRGVHSFGQAATNNTKEYNDRVQAHRYVSEHPLVRVHPETGERVLFVSPSFLKSIVGLSPRESQGVLELLWEHAVRPEFTARFKWEPGSVAMWDNRATSHLAPRDIFDTDFERQFYRVTILGDVPVGVDGKPSTSIEGTPVPSLG